MQQMMIEINSIEYACVLEAQLKYKGESGILEDRAKLLGYRFEILR